jgi:hypothetical protein
LKPIRVLALAALLMAACSTPGSGVIHSPIPIITATPSFNPADSKAADFRTRLDLLLGEHTMLAAKQAVAASNHTDAYAGYLVLLTANANSLVDIIRSAYGNTAATGFDETWRIQNGYLIDYTIGLVTHNDAKSSGSMSGLLNGFVPQFAKLIAGLTSISVASTTQLQIQQLMQLKEVIDKEVAQSYTAMYPALRLAYATSALIGDALAISVVQQFPDKFPGDASNKAVDARVSLNDLLQEHSYLATMTTDATVTRRTTEQTAAAASLSANAGALSKLLTEIRGSGAGASIGELWGARNSDLIAYATNGDAASRQGLTDKFVTRFYALAPTAADNARDQMLATIKVIDDQRAKAFKAVAADDRAAAAAMQPIADRIG